MKLTARSLLLAGSKLLRTDFAPRALLLCTTGLHFLSLSKTRLGDKDLAAVGSRFIVWEVLEKERESLPKGLYDKSREMRSFSLGRVRRSRKSSWPNCVGVFESSD